jgi:hypothetical protein
MAATEPKTTLYLRSLPRGLVRKVKARAAERGTTLNRFVQESLERSVSEPARSENEDELEEDRLWFEANAARLRARYEGNYVAILGGRIVDHDEDFAELAERVFARHGSRSILMPKVGAGLERVRLRSPRLLRV